MNTIEARQYLLDEDQKWTPTSTNKPLADIAVALKSIWAALVRPLWLNTTNGGLRVDTVTTVTTLTTLTNTVPMVVSNAAGGAASTALSSWESMVIIPMRNCWANEVRSNIA